VAAWKVLLAQAHESIARGDFAQAQRQAEAALRADPPKGVRATPLLVAANAAAAQRLDRIAAQHYGEILSKHGQSPEAPSATMGLGWTELRQGERDRARRTWTRFADTFPADPQAPLALALAAEVASDQGQLAAAQDLLDRILTRHARAPEAEGARLSRAIVLVRRNREDDAARDLDAIVQVGATSAIDERRRLVASLRRAPTEVAVAALPIATAVNGGGGGNGNGSNGNGGYSNGNGGHGNGGHSNGNGGRSPALTPAGDPLERFAVAFLETHDRASAPYVLHGLVVLGATNRGWTDPSVATLASRLLDDFPAYPPAPVLLARVGASAVAAGQWPLARRAYEPLVTRDPASPFAQTIRVDLAEALLRTGVPAEARRHLDAGVAGDARNASRALLLRAEASEALGDRRGALAAYDRVLAEHAAIPRSAQSLLAHAQLLQDAGQPSRARPVLERVVAQSKGEVVAEAAYRLATILGDAREHKAAVEWYLTAAYVAEGSRWTGPALLGAGASLAALNETGDALAIYRRLVPARAAAGRTEDRVGGEAAYRAAEIVRVAGRHEDALELYLTSAHLTPGSAAERRALVGAVRCLVAKGDRAAAEVIYRRLLASNATEPEHLAVARQALQAAETAPAR